MKNDGTYDSDAEWCSIWGYAVPADHACTIGVCYNPVWDGNAMISLEEAEALKKSMFDNEDEEKAWQVR